MALFNSINWPYYEKHVNLKTLNHTLTLLKLSSTNVQGLSVILFDANLFMNQTLLIFLLYVKQTWKTQLIPAISLCRVRHMDSLAVYVN